MFTLLSYWKAKNTKELTNRQNIYLKKILRVYFVNVVVTVRKTDVL